MRLSYSERLLRLVLSSLAGLLCLASCGDDSDVPNGCTTDEDCSVEQCIDGRCTLVGDRPDSGPRVDVGRADTGADAMMSDVPAVDAGPPPLQEWILSIDNEDDFNVHRLVRISIAAEDYGALTVICDDIALPSTVPAQNNISSLTFNNGQLYASGRGADDDLEGNALLLIEPCGCTATDIGRYAYTHVAGITSDGVQDMFGVSGRDDVVFRIDPMDAASTLLAELSSNWQTVGLTWSGPARNTLWGINGTADQLVELSPTNGSELRSIDLSIPFGSVGIEYHPGVDTIFACSNPGELLVVNPETGEVSVGPDLGLEDCNNLAAPFGAVECVL